MSQWEELSSYNVIIKSKSHPQNFYKLARKPIFLQHLFFWNDSNVQYKNKSPFPPRWNENDMCLIRQLFNSHGHLSYENFLSKFGIPVPTRMCSSDFIPASLQELFKHQSVKNPDPLLADVDICVDSSK